MAKKKKAAKKTTKRTRAKETQAAPTNMSSIAGVVGRPLFNNGLRSYSLQARDDSREGVAGAFAAAAAPPSSPLSDMSAQAAAEYYLQQSLASAALPEFEAPEVNGAKSEFKPLGIEVVPLTDTQTVKFRQYHRKVPVYGTLVTVELDKDNNLISINSAMGEPANVDHVARISPLQVMETVRRLAGYDLQPLTVVPRLVYFFDGPASRWRLAYLVEDVLKRLPDDVKSTHGLPQLVDYVIDAHTGELVAELPRTQTATVNQEVNVLDELGKKRSFGATLRNGVKVLIDSTNNVHTYDFQFQDIELNGTMLPGSYVPNPPTPWHKGAVSAHANAIEVAKFLRDVLKRNGLNNQGEQFVSSVNCRYWRHGSTNNEWRNAAWIGSQMVYGQKKVGNSLRSYAAAADVVAHEICHGLTDRTARLQYQGMTGALNESYSDIFGIIISNASQPNVGKWNWEMGEELEETGIPIRDFRDPPKHNQPDHMDNYVTTSQDNGGVHINSGIHNKAAYNVLTAKNATGGFLFDPRTVIKLFYLTLTQHLSRTSGFGDSRRGMLLSAGSLFRLEPAAEQTAKLDAIGQAFTSVGVT